MLHGLDQLIERVTGIPTYVAKKPISSVALGAGHLLPLMNDLPEGLISIPASISKR